LNGVEIDSTRRKLFLTELEQFAYVIETAWRTESLMVLERHGLESIPDDIFTAIETALESYVSPYDSAEV
jgi:hypothetical protein